MCPEYDDNGPDKYSDGRLGLAVALIQAAAARGSTHVREVAANCLLPGAVLSLQSCSASPGAWRAVCSAGQTLLIACCAARCAPCAHATCMQ